MRQLKGDAVVLAPIRRKGGVGTTTTTIAIASGLALEGYEVLVLEGDDNRRLSRTLLGLDRAGGPKIDDSQTTYHLFTNPDEGLGNAEYKLGLDLLVGEIPASDRAVVRERDWGQPATLRVVPGTRALRRLEDTYILATASRQSARFEPYAQLSRAITTFRRDYDFIVIDTPSMLSLITTNEIMAAQYVLFVLDFDPDSIYDYQEAAEFYNGVCAHCRNMNIPQPQVLGVVYNKYHSDRKAHQTRYQAYTERHTAPKDHPEAGRMIAPLIPYPELARLSFDDLTLDNAMHLRRPVHIVAPRSTIGNEMYRLVQSIKKATNTPEPISRF